MIKSIVSLLRQIVGRILMSNWFLTFGAMALPVGFTLITLKAVSDDAPVILYWLGGFCGLLGIFAFFIALVRAFNEDAKQKKERDAMSQIFKDIRGGLNEISKNMNTIIIEIRQDRDERNRKNK
jgi:hypothetical protein